MMTISFNICSRLFLLMLAIAGVTPLLAQHKKITHLTFLDQKIKVPSKCIAESEFELACEEYQVSWIYYPPASLRDFTAENWKQLKLKYSGAMKQPVKAKLNGQPAEAIKIIILDKRQTIFQIWAHTTIGDKGVFFQLVTTEDPLKTKDLPALVRPILQIEEQ